MHHSRFIPRLLGAAVAVGLSAFAGAEAEGNRPDHDSINRDLRIAAGTAAGAIETINGDITLEAGATAEDIESVNGDLQLGEGVRVRSIRGVNGDVRAAARVRIEGDVEHVNGRLSFGPGTQIGGGIEQVNGVIELDGTRVEGRLQLGVGQIEARASTIGGEVVAAGGTIVLTAGTRVAGDISVEAPRGRRPAGREVEPVRIVIGPDSRVDGTLRLARPAAVYVHRSARVGGIEGGAIQRYDGESPPD
jgi:hypothetical protein